MVGMLVLKLKSKEKVSRFMKTSVIALKFPATAMFMKTSLYAVILCLFCSLPCLAQDSRSNSGDIPYPLIIPVLVAAYLIRMTITSANNKKRLLEQLRSAGGQIRGGSVKNPELTIMCGGREIRIRIKENSNHSKWITSLNLSAGIAIPGRMVIRKKGVTDRLAEGMQLQGVIATNAPGFDAQFHIDSDNEAFAKTYFNSAEKQEAVEKLFREGCARIEFDSEVFTVCWYFELRNVKGAAFILNSLPHMDTLAKTSSRTEVPPWAGASLEPL